MQLLEVFIEFALVLGSLQDIDNHPAFWCYFVLDDISKIIEVVASTFSKERCRRRAFEVESLDALLEGVLELVDLWCAALGSDDAPHFHFLLLVHWGLDFSVEVIAVAVGIERLDSASHLDFA